MNRPIKDVVFYDDAKKPLIKGVNIVCDAVSSTYGYNGGTVLIETEGGFPKPTKDGVSVAKSFFLEDAIESLGAEYVKQAAQRTVDESGDGTSNTCILIQSLVNKSYQCVSDGGSARDVKESIERTKEEIISILKSQSRVITEDDYLNVATISANNDFELGEIISDAFKSAGKNGIVTFERSSSKETFYEHIDGMPIESSLKHNGYSNSPDGSLVFSNPLILVTDKVISSIREVTPILEHIYKNKLSLLIIGDVTDEVNNTLLGNKIKSNLNIAVVEPPSVVGKRTEYLKDIALVTGAVMLNSFSGDLTDGYGLDLLGTCEKFVTGKRDSVLMKSKEYKKQEIDAKIADLNEFIKLSDSVQEKRFLSDRVAKLSCGVSVIKVGAITESELLEKLDRVEDAVHAVRSAIVGGISAGGGVGFLNAYKTIENKEEKSIVLLESLLAPITKLNPLFDMDLPLNNGLNLYDNQIGNMFDMGIIDPTLVLISALENSVSVANTILMTNVCITYKRA